MKLTTLNFIKNLIDCLIRNNPVEIEKSERILYLLRSIYPTVDWKKVKFYENLPWFVSFSPSTSAITLPDFYGLKNIHIYFNKFDESTCQSLAEVVHEAYHVLQFKEIGYKGIGWFRLFMIRYLACFLIKGYRESPFEIPAYHQEKLFYTWCRENISALDNQILNHPNLVKYKSGFCFKEGLISIFFATVLTLTISILYPFLDILRWIIRNFILIFKRRKT